MSTFWSLWIISLTIICLLLVLWVLLANKSVAVKDDGSDEHNRTTGHSYDGIEEYDNPLPRWWFLLFVWSVVFGVGYLIWYPGMGAWEGIGKWTSKGQFEQQMAEADVSFRETYDPLMAQSIEDLAQNDHALNIGYRLFLDNCALCHGADGGGNFSIPDLSDNDWLYGGSPQAIHTSIMDGRQGNMPAWSAIIGTDGSRQVTEYVLKISSQDHDEDMAGQGQLIFEQSCSVCHGPEGQGSTNFGAPNLTDDIWLYSGNRDGILRAVLNGLGGEMPSQVDKLRKEKIHVLAAYVYSLSQQSAD